MSQITVAEFRELLKIFDDDAELSFEPLNFYRLKDRGDKLVHVEFNEAILRDRDGRLIVQE